MRASISQSILPEQDTIHPSTLIQSSLERLSMVCPSTFNCHMQPTSERVVVHVHSLCGMLHPEQAHRENQMLDIIWSSSGDFAIIQKLSVKTKIGRNSLKVPVASWLIGNPHFPSAKFDEINNVFIENVIENLRSVTAALA